MVPARRGAGRRCAPVPGGLRECWRPTADGAAPRARCAASRTSRIARESRAQPASALQSTWRSADQTQGICWSTSN